MNYSKEWNLGTIPEKRLKREYFTRIARKPRPGRRVDHLCKWCGKVDGQRVIAAHQPVCPGNPRVKRMQAAIAAEAKSRK